MTKEIEQLQNELMETMDDFDNALAELNEELEEQKQLNKKENENEKRN